MYILWHDSRWIDSGRLLKAHDVFFRYLKFQICVLQMVFPFEAPAVDTQNQFCACSLQTWMTKSVHDA